MSTTPKTRSAARPETGARRRRRPDRTLRTAKPRHARGFFTPSLVAALLVVIFVAVLFGTRVRDKSGNLELRYSDRYHELRARAQRSAEEEAELELEACRYRRDLLNYLKSSDAERYREARDGYAPVCGQILPLQ